MFGPLAHAAVVQGATVGLAVSWGAFATASTASPALIWGGMRVALTTTVFGLLLLTLAVLAWLGLYFVRGRQPREA